MSVLSGRPPASVFIRGCNFTHGRGKNRVRTGAGPCGPGTDACPHVRADACGHASYSQWAAQTRLSVRGDAALGG
jgi:hypothetical protein